MSLIHQSSKSEIVERYARHVSSGKADFFKAAGIDFVFGKREGIYVWDAENETRLIDCHCNGGVFNLGHRNPRVIDALRRAFDELDIGNHHFISEHRARLAERLAAISPGDLNRVIFGVSGGEAIDTAIKLARAHTKRTKIISALGGYHGHTGFALAAGEEEYSAPFAPLPPGFVQIPFGDLNALEKVLDDDTAAVLFETIPATMGIVIPHQDYFRSVRALCDRAGALYIADEVQSGLGRCGEIWAINTFDAIPDILVTAKGLSGGMYPMTATIYSDRLDAFLRANPFVHVSTAGGAEVGCYAALEVLNILQEPVFLENVRAMAELFRVGLAQLQSKYPALLVGVRQRGLMMGLQFASPQLGPVMTVAGFRFGVLMIYANYDKAVCQFLPPLIIQAEQVQETLMRLDRMLEWANANAAQQIKET